MTSTTAPAEISAALADLTQDVDRLGTCGLVYELWESRANDLALNHAAGFDADNRARFLDQAAERGLYMADGPAGWLLDATDTTCIHGLDPHCCPRGCGDIGG
jgi:hypothetical protein